jgi:hypothetical protein
MSLYDLWAARMFLRLALKTLRPLSLIHTYVEHIVNHPTSFTSSHSEYRSKNYQEPPASQIK